MQAARAVGKLAHLPDADLIAACLAGDADAWDGLVDRYEPLIYAIGLRMGLSQADAEDIYQDVCLLLLTHLGDLRDVHRLSSWLISTTKREVWRLLKRRSPLLESEIEDYAGQVESAHQPGREAPPSPEEAVLAIEDRQIVREAMTRLPDRCRRLLSLLYLQDPPCSYAETARDLGLAVGTIGSAHARCLQRLQKILEGMGF